MPQRVRSGGFSIFDLEYRLSYSFLNYPIQQMMSSLDLRLSIKVSGRRRKRPLPRPFSIRIGILPCQRERKHNSTRAVSQILGFTAAAGAAPAFARSFEASTLCDRISIAQLGNDC